MVSNEEVERQLKKIGFNYHGWGRTEVKELEQIILPEEEIYECVNGIYEGGFALLLASDIRVLLIDKKPLNYLRVEDLRFDMINEIDYNHRLIGAYITIATGNKVLKFTSLNQPRLRKLIGHVQACMAEAKKQQTTHQEGQSQHLERLNQQLQSYLLAQYRQQQQLHEQLQKTQNGQGPASVPLQQQQAPPEVKPSPELADYLYAQGLLAEHEARTGQIVDADSVSLDRRQSYSATEHAVEAAGAQMDDLYSEGMKEVFGKQAKAQEAAPATGDMFARISPEPSRHMAARALASALGSARRHWTGWSLHGSNQPVN